MGARKYREWVESDDVDPEQFEVVEMKVAPKDQRVNRQGVLFRGKDQDALDFLCDKFGINRSEAIKRAVRYAAESGADLSGVAIEDYSDVYRGVRMIGLADPPQISLCESTREFIKECGEKFRWQATVIGWGRLPVAYGATPHEALENLSQELVGIDATAAQHAKDCHCPTCLSD